MPVHTHIVSAWTLRLTLSSLPTAHAAPSGPCPLQPERCPLTGKPSHVSPLLKTCKAPYLQSQVQVTLAEPSRQKTRSDSCYPPVSTRLPFLARRAPVVVKDIAALASPVVSLLPSPMPVPLPKSPTLHMANELPRARRCAPSGPRVRELPPPALPLPPFAPTEPVLSSLRALLLLCSRWPCTNLCPH